MKRSRMIVDGSIIPKRLYSIGVVIKSNRTKGVSKGMVKITKGRRPLDCDIDVINHLKKPGNVSYTVRYDRRLMAESELDALRACERESPRTSVVGGCHFNDKTRENDCGAGEDISSVRGESNPEGV